MGALFSAIWAKFSSAETKSKIVIIGLSNAGKTTILYRLNLGTVVVTQPTIGSNVEEVTHRNLKFQVWDLGGQDNLRPTWSAYFQNVDAVIFVVDSNDADNLVLAKMELYNALLSEDLKDAVLLVLANKQDIQGAKPLGEICQDLDLAAMAGSSRHEWHIQACCAITGEGLPPAMDWLADRILERRRAKAQGGFFGPPPGPY